MSLDVLLLFTINLSDGTVRCVLLTSARHAHFHPLPIGRHCMSPQEGWGNGLGKGERERQGMLYLFPLAHEQLVTLVKKNSLLKKNPCSCVEAVPLTLSLVLATRP